ncbi:hypothetical protein KFK09_003923 [Dendrobium nobile]|uniref:FAD-binding FR-type domain-containing protein n=1 Tax=Dendrobium nobile TaxID=94219 RepID=A0A8T3BZ48_DENNO|nr:hypothetical protein KFK09_003923 [Dendrobium nobile]
MESKCQLRSLLKYSMAFILAAWAFVWILKPTQLWKRSWHAAEDWARPTFLGEIAAAVLAYAYLSISSNYIKPDETQITQWQRVGRVYLAGAIALVIELIVWITALPPIRRKYFEFFYSVHHLYAAFILFFLLHAGDHHFYLVFSGVLLFSLDKILRIIQSRRVISFISACILPCRAVELALKTPPSLRYTPSSILFLKIPSISKFQWHPFSIISSCNMDNERLSILVKCKGEWTNSLYEMVESIANKGSNDARNLFVSVEGPYGPIDFQYKRYDRLILVAGGSGIAPFISILKDVASTNFNLNRCAVSVNLIYVVRKSLDISMLTPISTVILHQPFELAHTIHLKLKIYVTQEQRSSLSARELIHEMTQTKPFILEPISSRDVMPAPEGLLWSVAITGLAFIVFLVSILCLTRAFTYETKKTTTDKTPSWVYNLLVICSFVIYTTSITVATVVSRCRRSTDNSITVSRNNYRSIVEAASTSIAQGIQQDYEINYGGRPNLIDILSEEATEIEENKVGVFVCGPDSMQESVASFCRKYSRDTKIRKNRRKKCSFVYHPINFTL